MHKKSLSLLSLASVMAMVGTPALAQATHNFRNKTKFEKQPKRVERHINPFAVENDLVNTRQVGRAKERKEAKRLRRETA